MIYAANVSEDDLADQGANNVHVQALKERAKSEGSEVVVVSAQVEAELNELDSEEANEYLADLGVEEGGLKSLIRATYKQLGLLTYFTTGVKETRAWTVKAGSTAPQAAGVIHSGGLILVVYLHSCIVLQCTYPHVSWYEYILQILRKDLSGQKLLHTTTMSQQVALMLPRIRGCFVLKEKNTLSARVTL